MGIEKRPKEERGGIYGKKRQCDEKWEKLRLNL